MARVSKAEWCRNRFLETQTEGVSRPWSLALAVAPVFHAIEQPTYWFPHLYLAWFGKAVIPALPADFLLQKLSQFAPAPPVPCGDEWRHALSHSRLGKYSRIFQPSLPRD